MNLYLLTSTITADSPPKVQFSVTEAAYGEIEQGLTEVYGAPSYSVVEFRDPYSYGDGLEIEAIWEGLATLSSGWQNPSGEGGVFLYIDRDADIAVSWDAPGWGVYLVIARVTRRLSRVLAGAGAPARSGVPAAPPPLCPRCV